jgi:rhodanese-related sulfurtransferase
MQDIEIKELKERMEKGENLVLIDVREEWEYEETNMGAKLIPLGTLPSRISEIEEHKENEIIIHCKTGGRSGQAKKFLMSQGFHKVRNLLGGIEAYNLAK